MTYGTFHIGIIVYIIINIITAEIIYNIKKYNYKKEKSKCWRTKPMNFTKEDVYWTSITFIFIIFLFIAFTINVINNWNIKL